MDEVADRLSWLLAQLDHMTPRAASLRSGRPGTFLGELRFVLRFLARTPRLLRQLPDDEQTRRLYRQATGADHDRSRADLGAVADRLSFLAGHSEALVRQAARWLVWWVASDRPARGTQHGLVEARFAALMDAQLDASSEQLFTEYEQAWRALLDMDPICGDR